MGVGTRTRSFPHQPESVPAARRFAAAVLEGLPPETLEVVELMVSELATNCIRHTETGFQLTIVRSDRQVRVEATDRAAGEPAMRSPRPTDPRGRGLKIIDSLSQAWGVSSSDAPGKTVWFTVGAPAQARDAQARRAARSDSCGSPGRSREGCAAAGGRR